MQRKGTRMSYKITIRYGGDYLHVQHTGDDSYQISLELWHRIAKACKKHKCFNILGESNTNKLLSTMDAFNHIKIFQDAGITLKHRIAWVDNNPATKQQFRFIENVLKNRAAANGGLFENIEEAKKWLLNKD